MKGDLTSAAGRCDLFRRMIKEMLCRRTEEKFRYTPH
jgi:hypothetical protein